MPYTLKGTSQIQLYSHAFFFVLNARVYFFFDQDEIVRNQFSFDKSPLIDRDNFREETFQSISHDFCYKLLANIAERDWPKPIERVGTFLFGGKGQKGPISAPTKFMASLEFQDHLVQIFLHNIPACFDKVANESVRSRCFSWLHVIKGMLDVIYS